MPIHHQLAALGLRPKEIELYLALAQSGKATATLLCKQTSFSRSTVYFLMEELLRRGLAAAEKKKSTTYFTAQPPQALVQMFARERDMLDEKISMAEELSKTLLPYFRSDNFRVPKLQFFEGEAAVRDMLWDHTERWHGSMLERDQTWWGFEDRLLYEHYRPWFSHIWKRYERERLQVLDVRVFTTSSVAAELTRRFPRTLLRPFPARLNFSSTLWLMGDYLLLFVTSRKPHYAFQIEDRSLGDSLRVVFRMLWEKA